MPFRLLIRFVFELVETLFDRADLLLDRVGNVNLIKAVYSSAVHADGTCGNADGGAVFWQGRKHDGVCRNFSVAAYFKAAEHLCARTNHDVVAERGVSFARIFSRSSEGHALIDRAIVADLGCFADDDGGAVVDEKSVTYFRARMYLDSGEKLSRLADCAR